MPRASIVVVNHDYARFLRDAVDSALAQTGVDVEVIVVDDGSTDGSRDVIAGYGARVHAVLQPNLGQAAAFNAGLAAARGDLVLFLDADDRLEADVVARAVAAVDGDPDVVRVAFRLAVIDAVGRPTGDVHPAPDVPLPAGDVRRRVLAHGDDLAWPPTSGNAFTAAALRRVMPLPVTEDKIDADAWLHPTIPLLGRVVALEGVGGAYRTHDANGAHRPRLDAARSRRVIVTTMRVHERVAELASQLGLGEAPMRSVTLGVHRMVSLRLAGPGHPVAGDTRLRVLREGIDAARARGDVGIARRVAYAAWFVAAALAPRRAVAPLAEAFFEPSRRPAIVRGLMRRAPNGLPR